MRKYSLILFISALLLSSCAEDDVMDRTIFIPDEENQTLPAYTEWGYNSFGAEYERDYFLASKSIVPCKIVHQNGQLQFSLHGKSRGKDMSLVVIFPLPEVSEYADLTQLNNRVIDLFSDDCTVKMIQDGREIELNILYGTLHFKRAQLLSIDDKVNRVILSGTFDLRFLQNNFPSSISDGRFDLGITDRDFYSYQF